MVNGIEIFRSHFKDFSGSYILIGGAACDVLMNGAGLSFRATKDLDLILVVEALNTDFVKSFWEFVKLGNYEKKEKSQAERKFYRFLNPENSDFPFQLELFAKNPDLLDLAEDSHLTPIPIDEDISSLSAILMDDTYYLFTLENSNVENQLHIASVESLICLKAKAFLDLKARKEKGQDIKEKEIRKHKNDVIRLAVTLTRSNTLQLPEAIANDFKEFLHVIESDPPDFKTIGKSIGLSNLNKNILNQIKQTFAL